MTDKDVRRRQLLGNVLLSSIDDFTVGRRGLDLIDVALFDGVAEDDSQVLLSIQGAVKRNPP